MRWNRRPAHGESPSRPADDDFHAWISSLPWVVERPYTLGTPGVRTFAIACDPLGVRCLWLVTGLPNGHGIAVIARRELAETCERDGIGLSIAPMSTQHTLLALRPGIDAIEIERVILDAYGALLS